MTVGAETDFNGSTINGVHPYSEGGGILTVTIFCVQILHNYKANHEVNMRPWSMGIMSGSESQMLPVRDQSVSHVLCFRDENFAIFFKISNFWFFFLEFFLEFFSIFSGNFSIILPKISRCALHICVLLR